MTLYFGGAGETVDIGAECFGETQKKIGRDVVVAPLDETDCIASTVGAFGEFLLRPTFFLASPEYLTTNASTEF